MSPNHIVRARSNIHSSERTSQDPLSLWAQKFKLNHWSQFASFDLPSIPQWARPVIIRILQGSILPLLLDDWTIALHYNEILYDQFQHCWPSHITIQVCVQFSCSFPDSKVHGANMGPIWGCQDPGGPYDVPMNLAIWIILLCLYSCDLPTHVTNQWLSTKLQYPQCISNGHTEVLN